MNAPEILSAVTTPFGPDGELDLAGLRVDLERLEPFVDGVFAAGTTGEFLSLSVGEHQAILETALQVFGPDRTVIHVGSPSTRQSLALTRASRELGAQRFAAITPLYLPASTAGIVRHWSAIKEACGGELYGYVFPDVAVTDLAPADLPQALSSGISGLKVSALASTRVRAYLDHAPEGFKVWSGNDADVPQVMALGGFGSVSGVSAVCPEPWAELRTAIAREDQARVQSLQAEIEALVGLLGPSIASQKYGLDCLGAVGGTCRMAIDEPDSSLKTAIAEALGASVARDGAR